VRRSTLVCVVLAGVCVGTMFERYILSLIGFRFFGRCQYPGIDSGDLLFFNRYFKYGTF
jgi:hypothetical protein